jgi:hypothetical protein
LNGFISPLLLLLQWYQLSSYCFNTNGAEISTRAPYAAESVNPQEATPEAAEAAPVEHPPRTDERKVKP